MSMTELESRTDVAIRRRPCEGEVGRDDCHGADKQMLHCNLPTSHRTFYSCPVQTPRILAFDAVKVIEGQVAFTFPSDKTKKENFQPMDGEAVLGKIRGFELSSWNFIGHDPQQFRYYGPMAQDFFAAF